MSDFETDHIGGERAWDCSILEEDQKHLHGGNMDSAPQRVGELSAARWCFASTRKAGEVQKETATDIYIYIYIYIDR